MTSTIRPDDLSSAEVVADPYPAYRQLRDRAPFLYTHLPAGALTGAKDAVRAAAVMSHGDAVAVLRDHETFSSRQPLAGTLLPRLLLIQDDPPQHTRYRRLVAGAFTPRRIAELKPEIAAIANELADAIPEGDVDFMSRFAVPLPMRVISRMLGIDESRSEEFKAWSDASLAVLGLPAEDRAARRDEMAAFFREATRSRASMGGDDLLSTLVAAKVDGDRLEEWEVLAFASLLLIAGNETTTNLLGNLLRLLAAEPGLWESLRADRARIDRVVEEALRFESPVQRLSRVTTREVTLSGLPLAAGQVVMVFFGAANRDPAVFADPDRFLPEREPGAHVAFGAGIHRCLGAPLAQTEARIALDALLDRFASVVGASSAPVRQTSKVFMLGYDTLPLRLMR